MATPQHEQLLEPKYQHPQQILHPTGLKGSTQRMKQQQLHHNITLHASDGRGGYGDARCTQSVDHLLTPITSNGATMGCIFDVLITI